MYTLTISLMVVALAFVGCGDKSSISPAGAGVDMGNIWATAVYPDFAAAGAQVDARLKVGGTRGALLYYTYCAACHTSKIYWREKKLATDMGSLKFQVRRWQASIGQAWTEDEITDVTRYLNASYYGFQDADQMVFLREKTNPER
jgi:mono/diheme cytochrome c family protein